MQRIFQRLGAAALAVCLTLGLSVPALAADSPRASAQSDGTFLRGTFTYGPHESAVDLTDNFIYSDDYFKDSSYTANEHLATMSMQMAAASISSEDADYPEKSQNVQALLTALGFMDVAVNDYYEQQMEQNTMGAAAAYKVLDDTTVLLAIVPRSAGYEKEWGGNFNVGTGDGDVANCYTTDPNGFQGTNGLHAGFQLARNIVLAFTKDYVADHSGAFAGKTVKVWTMGYSRGAATANLIGAALADASVAAIGLEIKPENIYAYTFGTPLTVASDSAESTAERYNGIHNYFADYDPVAMVPFADWGFTRYGQNVTYNAAARKTRMLRFLQTVNPNVYGKYTGGTGDPDNFGGYTLGEGLKLIPSGQNTTQEQFLRARIQHLTNTVATDRAVYVRDHQLALCTLVGFYLGESDDTVNLFIAGMKSDKTNLMMLVTMLAFYDWADQYEVVQSTEKAAQFARWMTEILPKPRSEGDAEDPKYGEEANRYLSTEAYRAFYDSMTEAEKLSPYFKPDGGFTAQTEKLVKSVLKAGLDNAGIAQDSKTREDMLSDQSVPGLTKFIGYFVFGTGTKLADLTDSEAVRSALTEKINTAATLIGNAGTYMRVHNNEVILSWLRTMDSYYDDPVSDDSDDEPTYSIRAAVMEHGAVKISKRYAAQGDRVTLSVLPEAGYELASLTVVDQKNRTLALTDAGDGRYTFIMPGSRVTVSAVFRAKDTGSAYESFSDLKADAWYHDGVDYALRNGLMNGYSGSRFGPNDPISRAAVVTILWRMAGSPAVNNAEDFTDVQTSAWYASAVRWAAETGVVNGYADGRFGTGDPVTREQLAAMLYRYAVLQGYDVSVGENTNILSYDDVFSVSQWAMGALQWTCGSGLMQGDGTNLLPKNSTTRAQMAMILMRMAVMNAA
mgnify:CR=1 FL=1